MNGFARNDKDFFASQILTKILANRPKTSPTDFIKNEAYLLGGIIIIGGKPVVVTSASSNENGIKPQIKAEEFEKAKAEILANLNQKSPADLWFDVSTYKLVSVKDEFQRANDVRLEDVQRVSNKIDAQPKVTVIVAKTTETTSTNKCRTKEPPTN